MIMKPHKDQLDLIMCTACQEEHPKKDFSKNNRTVRNRLKAQYKFFRFAVPLKMLEKFAYLQTAV